jgi:hypothetical protein
VIGLLWLACGAASLAVAFAIWRYRTGWTRYVIENVRGTTHLEARGRDPDSRRLWGKRLVRPNPTLPTEDEVRRAVPLLTWPQVIFSGPIFGSALIVGGIVRLTTG